jgi:hypothetical protein
MTTWDQNTVQIVCTLFSTVVAGIGAWILTIWSDRSQERRSFSEHVTKLIDLSMDYPFLEDDRICEDWPKTNLSDENKIRYISYCCTVFNLMEHIWEHCKGDPLKIRMILHVEELIWRHRCWWENEPENQRAYQQGFRDFVDRIIKKKKKELGK